MSLKEKIRQALDPRGPLGEILSPSDVFKERAGLPISTPHSARVQATTVAPTQNVRVTRFVAEGAEAAPRSRERVVGTSFVERWTPVYAKTDSLDPAVALRAAQTRIGWSVTLESRAAFCDCTKATWTKQHDGSVIHEACGRARAPVSAEDFLQQVQSLSIQASDEYLNGFYPTIPGSDSVMTANGVAKGGTRITKGRTEYNRKTKGMVHWDKGVVKQYLGQEAKAKEDREARTKEHAEMLVKQRLPVRGNLAP